MKHWWFNISPRLLQTLAWAPTRALLGIFCKFEVRGQQNLKGISQAIFAPNHANELDPIVVTAALSPLGRFAPMFYVARPGAAYKDDRFGWRKYIYSGTLFKSLGAYPAPFGLRDYEKSLAEIFPILQRGRSMCMFPEGKFTEDGKLGEPHGGVVYLSIKTGVPIVPVAIFGTFRLDAGTFLSRKRTIVVDFGTPIYPARILPDAASRTPDAYRQVVKDFVVPHVHSVYADVVNK